MVVMNRKNERAPIILKNYRRVVRYIVYILVISEKHEIILIILMGKNRDSVFLFIISKYY